MRTGVLVLVSLVLLASVAGKAMASDACKYDPIGAAHAHDGPPPPEPSPTFVALLDIEYNRHFAPCFPPKALADKHYGTVWLKFLIAADGSISEVQLDTSSGYTELDQAALDAAKNWRAWYPARKNGVPYASWKRTSVTFSPSANPK